MSLAELLWKDGDDLSPENLSRRMRLIHNRLAVLEVLGVDWIAETDKLTQVGLERIDSALQPAYDSIFSLADLGALLTGASSSSVTVGTGEKTFVVDEDERAQFAPAAYVSAFKTGDPTIGVIGQVVSYDRETGVLVVDVEHVTGSGTHAAWTISATAAPNLPHETRPDNPHAVDADQVGAYTTGQVDAAIAAHAGDTANPHDVDAGQVGAYTTAQTDAAIVAEVGTVKSPLDFTSVRPTLDLIFDDPAGFPDTFRRPSPAVYFDALGIMKTAAADQPRIDHDPVTGECLGLLVEEARENIALHNTNVDDAVWTKLRASIDTGTVIAAPDGTLTAYKLVEDTSDNSHLLYDAYAFEAGKTYIWSHYLKADERGVIDARLHNAAFGANVQYRFDLSAKTAVQVTAGTNDSAGIEDIGGGWFRIWITADATTTATANCYIFLHDGVSNTYLGDGVSGLYPWGGQVEEGEAPTSLIVTGATPVTREADKLMLALDDWYNPAGGTLYMEATAPAPLVARNALAIDDNTGDNYILLRDFAAPARIDRGGVLQANLVGSWFNGSTSKLAVAFVDDDFAMSQDGAAVTTDNSGTVPTGLTQMQVGGRLGTTFFNGHIKRVIYWPRRLADAVLEAMAAWNA